jgi:uncharacterized protein YecE (DUF72 family)
VTATETSVEPGPAGIRLHVGASGWSYPTWKPGFYPAGTDASDFLPYYAERFDTVELNTTGYRLPAEDQFRRWADQVPDGFEFAPKLPGHRLRGLDVFADRVRMLGTRLGPVRVSLKNARDDGVLALMLGSLDPSLRLAFDLEHRSWDGVEDQLSGAGAVRVNDLDHPAPFRYLRRRTDEGLEELAARITTMSEPVYVYFRHEDEPSAPAYAQRLRELLGETRAADAVVPRQQQ